MTAHPLLGKKISLYDKPIKMVPKVALFKKDAGRRHIKQRVQFWPATEEATDDELPKAK